MSFCFAKETNDASSFIDLLAFTTAKISLQLEKNAYGLRREEDGFPGSLFVRQGTKHISVVHCVCGFILVSHTKHLQNKRFIQIHWL